MVSICTAAYLINILYSSCKFLATSGQIQLLSSNNERSLKTISKPNNTKNFLIIYLPWFSFYKDLTQCFMANISP
jgi:hypothetical protein